MLSSLTPVLVDERQRLTGTAASPKELGPRVRGDERSFLQSGTAVRGQRVSGVPPRNTDGEPCRSGSSGGRGFARRNRCVQHCQRPGPVGISLYRTGLRQKRSQVDSGTAKARVGGAEVAESCPQKGELEGARVSMSAERSPLSSRTARSGDPGRLRAQADPPGRCVSREPGGRSGSSAAPTRLPDNRLAISGSARMVWGRPSRIAPSALPG